MVRALAASFAPHAWVNVHSGMEALFMPYDHRTDIPTGESLVGSLLLERPPSPQVHHHLATSFGMLGCGA